MPKNEPWLDPFIGGARGLIFFDVGANRGDFTEWAARRFTQVYAWEPDPRAFEVLQSRARCNVKCFSQAVGSSPGKARLGLSTDSLQSTMMIEHPLGHGKIGSEVEVEVVTLGGLDMTADWIKIDVEGWEPAVILGMANSFPNLIVECHGNREAVLDAMRHVGYDGKKVVVDHPLGCEGHEWLIAEGKAGFHAKLKEVIRDAD